MNAWTAAIFLTSLTLELGSSDGHSQNMESARHSGPMTEILRLDMQCPRSEVVLYEPLVVTYRVRNTSDSPVKRRVDLEFSARRIRIGVQDEEGVQRDYFSGAIGCGPSEDMDFAAGEIWAESVVVFYNDLARDLAFPRPGRYKVSGELHVGGENDARIIKSEPIDIRVTEPGDLDRGLIGALGSENQFVNLLRRTSHEYCKGREQGPCFEELRGLARTFASSAYAPAIALDLAETLHWGGIEVEPRGALEIEILEEFLRRWPQHPLGESVTRLMTFALDKVGRKADAIAWIDRFEREYPGRRRHVVFMRQKIQGIGL